MDALYHTAANGGARSLVQREMSLRREGDSNEKRAREGLTRIIGG